MGTVVIVDVTTITEAAQNPPICLSEFPTRVLRQDLSVNAMSLPAIGWKLLSLEEHASGLAR